MSDLIDLCQKLVQFPSLSGETDAVVLFMRDYFQKSGFMTRLIDFKSADANSVRTLYASYGNGHPHLLFAGHIDVVPAVEAEWKYPPFAADIVDDKLFGRGIADMKGGLACFASACRDFVKHADFQGKISVIISADEEKPIVESTKKLMETLHGEGERFDFALVGEPSNPQNMGDEIKVGRRGDIVLHLTSCGQGGHTAYAKRTDNPICNLIELLAKMQNDALDEGNAYFAPSSFQVTTFDVGNMATNVVPSVAKACADIRFNSEHTYKSIENWAQKHIKNTTGNFLMQTEYIGEAFLSPINDYIKCLQKIITEHTGKAPKYSTAGGTSDARFIKNYCPVAEYGLTNATIHKANECESLQNIEILYQVYTDFLYAFFKQKLK